MSSLSWLKSFKAWFGSFFFVVTQEFWSLIRLLLKSLEAWFGSFFSLKKEPNQSSKLLSHNNDDSLKKEPNQASKLLSHDNIYKMGLQVDWRSIAINIDLCKKSNEINKNTTVKKWEKYTHMHSCYPLIFLRKA